MLLVVTKHSKRCQFAGGIVGHLATQKLMGLHTHLAVDTLAVRLAVPLIGSAEVSHFLCASCGAHKKGPMSFDMGPCEAWCS